MNLNYTKFFRPTLELYDNNDDVDEVEDKEGRTERA